jgi:hypothetical protein
MKGCIGCAKLSKLSEMGYRYCDGTGEKIQDVRICPIWCPENKNEISDTELLDFLEAENKKARYTGKCLFRISSTDRGWRLHETSGMGAYDSVRDAIKAAMKA